MELHDILQEILDQQLVKLVLSNKRGKQQQYQKAVLRPVKTKNAQYQLELFTQTQAFHENITKEQAASRLIALAEESFKQLDAATMQKQYIVKMNDVHDIYCKRTDQKQPQVITQSHNRTKQYLLPEGLIIEPLIELGIFTKEGKIVASKYDKYKQINRFIEMIDDVLRKEAITELHIVDFGCGKSYLTFILYYYLVFIKKIKATMVGLDLKEEVIAHCNEIAARYQYEGLTFQKGDIAQYQSSRPVDMMISLHACDTATDLALYHAISWECKWIFSVPCCQHELNAQFATNEFPLLGKYGIIKERISSLFTDAMRGQLLELCGYDVNLLEFIDLEHSPKNILIRAIKKPRFQPNEQLLAELKQVEEAFHAKLTLHQLLQTRVGE